MEKPKENKIYSKCIRCGRPLRDAQSQQLGMGKICYEKYKKEELHKKLF